MSSFTAHLTQHPQKLIKMFFVKCETSLSVLFLQAPFSCFLLLLLSEACASLHVVLGSCITSWMSCCALQSLLEGFLHVSIMAPSE